MKIGIEGFVNWDRSAMEMLWFSLQKKVFVATNCIDLDSSHSSLSKWNSQMNSERIFFIFASTCRLDITNNNYYFDAQIFVAERSDWISIKWLSCFELSCFKCFNLFEILAHQYKFWFYYKTLRVIRFHCDNQSSLICRHEPSININATLHAVCGSWCMRRSRC